MESRRLPARISTYATEPLMAEARVETAMPSQGSVSGRGSAIRSHAVTAMATEAPRIASPSNAEARYSAFVCPKWCSASGGVAATRSAQRATAAARRFTTDSTASDSRPTEPVSFQAKVLIAIVAKAAPMERSA